LYCVSQKIIKKIEAEELTISNNFDYENKNVILDVNKQLLMRLGDIIKNNHSDNDANYLMAAKAASVMM